jgi:hypothetical protein
MSNSTSLLKKKIELNGINYRWGDLYDSWNTYQKEDFDGTGISCNDLIPQENGPPLPSLAEQWKEDYKKRIKTNGKSSRNR